jgi:hypothetical protein
MRYTTVQLTDFYAQFSQATQRPFAVRFSRLSVAMLMISNQFGCLTIKAHASRTGQGSSRYPCASRRPNLFHGQVKTIGRFFL